MNLAHNRFSAGPAGRLGRCLADCTDLQSLDLEDNGLFSIGVLGLQSGVRDTADAIACIRSRRKAIWGVRRADFQLVSRQK